MYYLLVIFILAIMSLYSSKTTQILSSLSLIVSPVVYLLTKDADIINVVPMLWLLIITTFAFMFVISHEDTEKNSKIDSVTRVINKGSWLLSLLVFSGIIVLVIYDNVEIYEKLIDYSELVKKPSYLHLDTLINFSPIVIFSLSGLIVASSLNRDKK